jgi:predicted metal-binding protein
MEKYKEYRDVLDQLLKIAIANGATQAKVIESSDIVVDRRVRLKCMVPPCTYFGRHLFCPPEFISIDEFEKILKSYKKGLILQIEGELNSTDKAPESLTQELYKQLEEETGERDYALQLHKLVNTVEREAFKLGLYYATGFIAGACKLCEECVGPGNGHVCRHPFEARPSMEAMGIDVYETLKRAGLSIRFSSPEKVRWTGLVLLY